MTKHSIDPTQTKYTPNTKAHYDYLSHQYLFVFFFIVIQLICSLNHYKKAASETHRVTHEWSPARAAPAPTAPPPVPATAASHLARVFSRRWLARDLRWSVSYHVRLQRIQRRFWSAHHDYISFQLTSRIIDEKIYYFHPIL